MINMNARLQDSVALQENIRKFLEISIAPNLFDEHPPFQIDGNFGYAAGVAEALLQSHEGFIRLLPALPADWPDGSIDGLKARGNIEVALRWANGKLVEVGLVSADARDCELRYKSRKVSITLPAGKQVWLNGSLNSLKP
jgi:alpha-L-fucosidase 2